MKRDLEELSRESFDLLVVGGGISGACIAWDAALRGLSVALIEKDDFGHATSSASSKIVHGGIRYLQQGLIHRVRDSARERTALLRIAPHLVRPVPFLVPTYGHGLRGKEILAAGMAVYDLLTRVRDGVDDPAQRIPGFRVLSRREMLETVPTVPRRDLTGGVVYYDAQMHSAERTTLSFLLSAAATGARVANYVEATGLLRDGDRVIGVSARDRVGGGELEIRARLVSAVTGPWVFRIGDSPKASHRERMAFSKGIHVVTRSIHPFHALALATRLPNEAMINRGGRHIFLIPWRGHTLIGTTNVPFSGDPDDLAVTEKDVVDFLAEINGAWPAANLGREEILYAYGGLYQLFGARLREGVFQSASRYRIFDHARLDGIEGLLTVLGARFTTARRLAEETVNLVFRKLGHDPPGCRTETTRLCGGDIERIDDFVAEGMRRWAPEIGEDAARDVLHSYGTRSGEVLAARRDGPDLGRPVSDTRSVPGAVIRHAVREEMAIRLSDVVFRRTGIGTIGDPGEDCLRTCAGIMASELGWEPGRVEREIAEARAAFTISR